jgi:hypothetical protein
MSSPICRHKFRESCLAPSFNDERNLEGSGRQLRSERAACWWLVAGETRDNFTGCLLALRDKRACNNATFLFLDLAVTCALSLTTPLAFLTLPPPHCIQLAIHTPPPRRVSSPQRTSTSQLTNMSYRVGMYRTYDTTTLATEICCLPNQKSPPPSRQAARLLTARKKMSRSRKARFARVSWSQSASTRA